jgi:hypothetical protein
MVSADAVMEVLGMAPSVVTRGIVETVGVGDTLGSIVETVGAGDTLGSPAMSPTLVSTNAGRAPPHPEDIPPPSVVTLDAVVSVTLGSVVVRPVAVRKIAASWMRAWRCESLIGDKAEDGDGCNRA